MTAFTRDDEDDKHVKSKTILNLNPFAWTSRAVNEAKRQIRIVHLMGWASWIYMARGGSVYPPTRAFFFFF